MPDVDIDISSRRRQEVLDWVEARFGGTGSACEAMVTNRVTYRLRSALQDVGRALGLPPDMRNRLSHALGRDYSGLRPHRVREATQRFTEILGQAPVKETMLDVLSTIEPGFTRHFAPHSGGTVLSHSPLTHYSPQFKSANGMRVLQFDKDDVERLGLIKLDLLGLRMLGALELAREEVHRLEGCWLDLLDLPDEPAVWEMIDVGETLTLFQIESPGQTRLSVQLKPRNLTELAHQIAIHRPGPIQSGTVRPYVQRHLNLEEPRYAHPVLEHLLGNTYGVVLFQEDVLRLAVHFAGMTWSDGDRFRKQVSTAEDDEILEREREAFVRGATRHVGATREQAEEVFTMIHSFRGYGFTQSHAFAFAQHAYASAYLKLHYPAEWLSAVLNELPGMWPLHTLRQDARKWGVPFFKLDINRSGVAWHVERNDDGTKGVRVPLTAVEGVPEETAQALVMNRLEQGPYEGVDDLYQRLSLELTALKNLVRAGAFDSLTSRRLALYRLHALRHTQPPGERPLFSAVPSAPPLKRLNLPEQYAWDLQLKRFSELGLHPMDLIRNQLRALGVVPLDRIRAGSQSPKMAGLIVARQKPPTAGGAAFYVIEDGPVRVQVQISPELWEQDNLLLRDATLLIVRGEVFQEASFTAIRARQLWHLPLEVKVRGYDFG
jgi:error-prone DNA polymerase